MLSEVMALVCLVFTLLPRHRRAILDESCVKVTKVSAGRPTKIVTITSLNMLNAGCFLCLLSKVEGVVQRFPLQ
jgi:hypothetical protein